MVCRPVQVNRNLRTFTATPKPVTMLALMQAAHQKEAYSMENLKMQTLPQYKKRTIWYGPANSPPSSSAAQCRQAWNNSCTNANSTLTRSVEYGEFKKANPTSVQKTPRTMIWYGAANPPASCSIAYSAVNGNDCMIFNLE